MLDTAPRTPSPDQAEFAIRTRPEAVGGVTVSFQGDLSFHAAQGRWADVREAALQGLGNVALDVSGLNSLDGGSAALLIALRSELCALGRGGVIEGGSGSVQTILDLYGAHPLQASAKAAPRRTRALDDIGLFGYRTAEGTRETFAYLGEVVLAIGRSLRHPRRFPRTDFLEQFSRCGPDAVPIVAMILFLVGAILGLQAAAQLETFGAEIFMADLVGLSVVRELGPLMTGILLSGRTGAAFAAELGTMRVSEEIDALRTFGLSPVRFLVIPRLAALALAAPMLTLLADAVGVFGGGVIGVATAGLTPVAYWNATQAAIDGSDLFGGLFKSVVFAVLIGLVSCRRGLAAEGGAAGVGRATTGAVVTTIFFLVATDAVFTFLFDRLGV